MSVSVCVQRAGSVRVAERLLNMKMNEEAVERYIEGLNKHRHRETNTNFLSPWGS